MEAWLLPILVIVLFAFAIFMATRKSGSSEPRLTSNKSHQREGQAEHTTFLLNTQSAVTAPEPSIKLQADPPKYDHISQNNPNDEPDKYPYRARAGLLTEAELKFYLNLRDVVEDRAVICPKVRLSDIVELDNVQWNQTYQYSNRINAKHIDYLLCEPGTMNLVAGVELDDRSHKRADRQERDEFVGGVFAAAGIPLLHFPVQQYYRVGDLEAALFPHLGPTPKRRPAAPSVPASGPVREPAPTNAAPCCPHCSSIMGVRTAQSGEQAGKQYWVCSCYPNCKGILAYTTPIH